jgi:hypothetical protein
MDGFCIRHFHTVPRALREIIHGGSARRIHGGNGVSRGAEVVKLPRVAQKKNSRMNAETRDRSFSRIENTIEMLIAAEQFQ